MGHGHYAPTNEAMDHFYEELKAVFGNLPCKDVKNEMEDMNAKVGTDNTGRTEVMEVIKAKGEVSEEVLVGFCNWIWNEEKVFEEWNKGVLIKLQKKGNLSHSKS
ncbi:unnamed protein product [Porites lobata]|uniref:Uncharacterized protein n=1 Tax=Porites lobata TaxID=104759 RepID=A0ABN8PN36_9CNID|nr:unnamed protein product [Porites lobata]